MDKLTDIKVIIWDFDNTLYQNIPALYTDVRNAEKKLIKKYTGWCDSKIDEEFYKLYKIKYQSATKVVAEILQKPPNEVTKEIEQYFDRTLYLNKDEKLIEMFNKLKNFKHYILTNGNKANIEKGLIKLGIELNIFQEVIANSETGILKPDIRAFQYILDKTKLPPQNHLMVGDRDAVDLAPAKSLGMKTCLVWSDKKSEVADVTVPTVYNITNYII